MADVHNEKTRSYNMSKISGINTKPEIIVRKYLHSKGLRYVLYNRNLPGKPDLVFPKYKTIIFINGCFWHGHEGCRYYSIPKTRTEWWKNKIDATIKRDKKIIQELKEHGWKILTIWECELKPQIKFLTLERILHNITNEAITDVERKK